MFRLERATAVTLLCWLGLLVGCSVQSQPRLPVKQNVPTQSPIVVHAFDVQAAANLIEGDLLIPASLSVADTAVVLAEREGRIVNLSGQEGARVNQGDILAQFNDDDQRVQLKQAQLEVSRLEVEGQQYEAMIKLNRSELDRETLLASQGLVSKGDVERAQYKLEQSLHEVEKTRLAIETAKAHVEEVKVAMQKSIVRAPVTGVITRRYVAPGTTVVKNDKLFDVCQLSKMELRFRVPQDAGGRFTPGQLLDLSTADPQAFIAKARIRRLEPIADATSNTFGYVADILGTSVLIPGQTVYVHIRRNVNTASYWVPRAAFRSGPDMQAGAANSLFVIKDDKALARSVSVRAIEGDQVEILSGLVKDERVVLAAPSELKDGDHVEVR